MANCLIPFGRSGQGTFRTEYFFFKYVVKEEIVYACIWTALNLDSKTEQLKN